MKYRKHLLLKTCAMAMVALFLFFSVIDSTSHARAGGGRSSGSSFRSSGSYGGSSSPYRSSTSPSMTQRPLQQPSSPYSPGRSFLYGLGGGLMGGMLGSMLFGRSGHAASGWGGGGGFGFGDLLILIIIGVIIYFIVKRYRARKALEMNASSPGGYGAYGYTEPAYDQSSSYYPPVENSVAAGLRHIAEMDPSFNENAFRESTEDMFFKIQGGWTKRDLSGIRHLLTPEMYNIFQNDVNNFITDKKLNKLENVAVRQVDIVNAIQDQGLEYITVHFLASLLDYTVDETTGSVLSGSSTDPVKFTEYWTFTRRVGDRNWALSAITQEQDYR